MFMARSSSGKSGFDLQTPSPSGFIFNNNISQNNATSSHSSLNGPNSSAIFMARSSSGKSGFDLQTPSPSGFIFNNNISQNNATSSHSSPNGPNSSAMFMARSSSGKSGFDLQMPFPSCLNNNVSQNIATSSHCSTNDHSHIRRLQSLLSQQSSDHLRNFSRDLFITLSQAADLDKQNVFHSPLSVWLALLLCKEGATGDTLSQFEQLMGRSDVSTAASSPSALPLPRFGESEPQLSIANSIWIKKQVKLDYCRLVSSKFDAECLPLTTATAINQWASNRTHGKITDLVDVIQPHEIAVLVNAIYFKGQWRHKFNPTLTRPMTFHAAGNVTKTVPIMHIIKQKLAYAEFPGFQALSLPYQGSSGVSALILLPHGGSPTELLCAMRDQNFGQSSGMSSFGKIESSLKERDVAVWLPKFSLEFGSVDLSPHFKSSLSRAFQPGQAQFSNLVSQPDLFCMSRVLHKARIDVDEEGTEAAAATAVSMAFGCAASSKPTEFRVDRPFIFMLRMNSHTLFAGVVNDPSTQSSNVQLDGANMNHTANVVPSGLATNSVTVDNPHKDGGWNCDVCKQPILGSVRYRCMQCADFDMCPSCEALFDQADKPDPHNPEHILFKLRKPHCSGNNVYLANRSSIVHSEKCRSCQQTIVGIRWLQHSTGLSFCEACESKSGLSLAGHSMIRVCDPQDQIGKVNAVSIGMLNQNRASQQA